MKKLMVQMFRFGIVGGLAFLIDYSILFILNKFLGIHYLLAGTISFSCSVIFNYILSTKWVFDVREDAESSQSYKSLKFKALLNALRTHSLM